MIHVSISVLIALLADIAPPDGPPETARFGVFEQSFRQARESENPYADTHATAEVRGPGGQPTWRVPLFWDGGRDWKLRVSPDRVGAWTWTVRGIDPGLDGTSGRINVVDGDRRGGIRPMDGHPLHFQREDGSPFYFLGDTAWALYTDSEVEGHDRQAALDYIDVRAAQGVNVVHSMLMSEAGWGNLGGPAFDDLGAERINPAYWREVDHRLTHLNAKGITGGLALAWSDKGRNPNNWRDFPSQDARERYARYVAARYGAFDVYFVVGGEWDLEIKRSGHSREALKGQYEALGEAVDDADPHGRMIAIHPGGKGGVEEFAESSWVSFGDYQQTYPGLHAAILESRDHDKPVVNSEYAYYLRDQDGDGRTDKDNSIDLESIRHASYDIAMAGGYLVTGFGTTYFGGNRDPGPFDLHAAKNDDWEEDLGHIRTLFESLEWWKLEPRDDLLNAAASRGDDRTHRLDPGGRRGQLVLPPAVAYWTLAEPGRQYVAYVRGIDGEATLTPGIVEGGPYRLRQFDPRTGRFDDLGTRPGDQPIRYQPPDSRDWVLVVTTDKP